MKIFGYPRIPDETRQEIFDFWYLNPGLTMEKIADRFGVEKTVVGRIVTEKLNIKFKEKSFVK